MRSWHRSCPSPAALPVLQRPLQHNDAAGAADCALARGLLAIQTQRGGTTGRRDAGSLRPSAVAHGRLGDFTVASDATPGDLAAAAAALAWCAACG